MSQITATAVRLREICNRYGDHPAARGAAELDIARIKQTFEELRFPLPDALIEVYRTTVAIPGVLNSMPVLAAPCPFASKETAPYVVSLINQIDESDEEEALWLGFGNEGSLIIDIDGKCALEARRRTDGTVELIDPMSFEDAFLAYVMCHEAELFDEFTSK